MRSIAMSLAQSLGAPEKSGHHGCWEMCACHFGARVDEEQAASRTVCNLERA